MPLKDLVRNVRQLRYERAVVDQSVHHIQPTGQASLDQAEAWELIKNGLDGQVPEGGYDETISELDHILLNNPARLSAFSEACEREILDSSWEDLVDPLLSPMHLDMGPLMSMFGDAVETACEF